MIEKLETKPIFAGGGIAGYVEPTSYEIRQKINEIIEHINRLEEK